MLTTVPMIAAHSQFLKDISVRMFRINLQGRTSLCRYWPSACFST